MFVRLRITNNCKQNKEIKNKEEKSNGKMKEIKCLRFNAVQKCAVIIAIINIEAHCCGCNEIFNFPVVIIYIMNNSIVFLCE